jgi:hypothetical protein
LVGIEEAPPREWPASQQNEAGDAPAGAQIDKPHWRRCDLGKAAFDYVGKTMCVFNMAVDRPRAEVPQLASLFEDREKGRIVQRCGRQTAAASGYSGSKTT